MFHDFWNVVPSQHEDMCTIESFAHSVPATLTMRQTVCACNRLALILTTCLLLSSKCIQVSGFGFARAFRYAAPRSETAGERIKCSITSRRGYRNGRETVLFPRIHRRVGVGASPEMAAGSSTGFEFGIGGVSLEEEGSDRTSTDRKPLVDARQVSAEEVRRRWPETTFEVPDTLRGAIQTFFEQSTPRLIILGVFAVLTLRLSCGVDLGIGDAAAIPSVAVGWSFQEWAIHKYLLHGFEDWLGYDVHSSHHDKPFYHVCVDPPDLVVGWTAAAASIFWLLLPTPLALTVLGVYMVMGGVYEWTHYIVHTRVVPSSRLGKELKRHHTLHHLKDDSCWLAFTAPQIDYLLGTVPRKESSSVPVGVEGEEE